MIGHVQVVKKAGAKLQMRVVQPALVEHWSQRIRSLARDVSRINEVSLFLHIPGCPHLSQRPPCRFMPIEGHYQHAQTCTYSMLSELA